MKPDATSLSIIIPTYKEANNLPSLIQRIANLPWEDRKFEVILVDDNSNDGTLEIIDQLRSHYPWLTLIVRTSQRGLSRSVIDGFKQANHPLIIIMDADLSHYPEKIPEILNMLDRPETEMVIGSRYVDGGWIDQNWSLYRKIISRVSAWLARLLLMLSIKDPLSGFIGIKKDILNRTNHINPVGWKIGLELIVRCQCKSIVEIPIQFSARQVGKSKLTLKIGWNYLQQLITLFLFKSKSTKNEI